MKKKLCLMAVFLISIALFGCKGGVRTTKVQDPSLANKFAIAPKWVLDPSMEGRLAVVGSSKRSNAGIQHTRLIALAKARDELAKMMTVKVKNMVKNFTKVTGIGDDETVDKVSTNVSKQITNQVLAGSRQKDIWISPSGEVYVFVILDPSTLVQAIKESVMSSYKNERILWQKFQTKKAQEELDAEIEKEFGHKAQDKKKGHQ